jgi:hypothetical protein
VTEILSADRAILEALAQRLLEVEVVEEHELREIMGLPPRKQEPSEDRVIAPPPVIPDAAATSTLKPTP